MRTLKSKFVLLTLLFIGVLAMSFTLVKTNTSGEARQTEVWRYTGTNTAGHSNPANYVPADGSESCPGTSPIRCTLQAPDNGSGQPDLSEASNITFRGN